MSKLKEKKEEKEEMRCPFCGGNLIWGMCEMASEVSDDYEGDDEAVVSFCSCDTCGRDFEVYDPVESDRKGEYADYWDAENEEDEDSVVAVVPVNKSFAVELVCMNDEGILRDLKIDAGTGDVRAILSDGDVEVSTGDYLVLMKKGNWRVMSEKKEG